MRAVEVVVVCLGGEEARWSDKGDRPFTPFSSSDFDFAELSTSWLSSFSCRVSANGLARCGNSDKDVARMKPLIDKIVISR